jgi:beta-dihydromenaquinone-9 omega-hydroxylase
MLQFDPYDPDVLADPYPYYRRLRHESPLYYVQNRGYWVLSRYEDVRAAYRDHERYSSAKGNAPEPGFQPGLIGKDPPTHTRLRRIVQSVFTKRAIESQWANRLAEICDRLIDPLVGKPEVDAFAKLTLPLPVQVITEMLGIPDGDLEQFKQWTDDMVAGVSQHLDPDIQQRTVLAFQSLFAYFAEKVEERKQFPQDDLITRIVRAGEEDRLTTKEAVHFCILLLIAGNETTTNLLGNSLLALMQFPEEQAKLRSHRERMPQAVEEMLRFGQPSHCFFRETTCDVSMYGTTIPVGSRVMLSIASGNRDEQVFDNPDVFMIDRESQHDHLAFGSGIHFCLGSMLARLETRVFFEVLLRKTTSFQLTGIPKLIQNPIVRGPIYLPMKLVS